MKFAYPVGAPLWRWVARAGVPLFVQVELHHDAQSQSYWANSPNLDGLVVSGRTLDEVKDEVLSAAALLLEDVLLSSQHPVMADLHLASAVRAA